MDIDIIMKAAGVAMIITVLCQIMTRAGRDEQSTLLSVVGMVVMLIVIAGRVGELIGSLREVFGI